MFTYFTIDEKKILKGKINFLLKNGFIITEEDDRSFRLQKNKIKIVIHNTYRDELSDIFIYYESIYETFYMSWFAIESGIKLPDSLDSKSYMERIVILIDYVEENFDNLMNIRYCLDMSYKTGDYIRENYPPPYGERRKRYTEEELQELEKKIYKSENKSESFFKKIFKK